jgi:hypothetical protein
METTAVECGSSIDLFDVVQRVEDWRCSHDIIYRLFASNDNRELLSYVAGLVGETGLLQSRYGAFLDVSSQNVLQTMKAKIIQLEQSDCAVISSDIRLVCHFLLIVSMVLEHEFLNYIVLSVHSRDQLRTYITNFLAPALANFLQGIVQGRGVPQSMDAFELVTFVNTCRVRYIMTCKPVMPPASVPPRQN